MADIIEIVVNTKTFINIRINADKILHLWNWKCGEITK